MSMCVSVYAHAYVFIFASAYLLLLEMYFLAECYNGDFRHLWFKIYRAVLF